VKKLYCKITHYTDLGKSSSPEAKVPAISPPQHEAAEPLNFVLEEASNIPHQGKAHVNIDGPPFTANLQNPAISTADIISAVSEALPAVEEVKCATLPGAPSNDPEISRPKDAAACSVAVVSTFSPPQSEQVMAFPPDISTDKNADLMTLTDLEPLTTRGPTSVVPETTADTSMPGPDATKQGSSAAVAESGINSNQVPSVAQLAAVLETTTSSKHWLPDLLIEDEGLVMNCHKKYRSSKEQARVRVSARSSPGAEGTTQCSSTHWPEMYKCMTAC